MAAKYAMTFNPVSGQFDLVTVELTPPSITGGTPNTLAGWDSTGALESLSQWSVDPDLQNLSYIISVPGADSRATYNQINSQTNLNGTVTGVARALNLFLDGSGTTQGIQGILLGVGAPVVGDLYLIAASSDDSIGGNLIGYEVASSSTISGSATLINEVFSGSTGADLTYLNVNGSGNATGNFRGASLNNSGTAFSGTGYYVSQAGVITKGYDAFSANVSADIGDGTGVNLNFLNTSVGSGVTVDGNLFLSSLGNQADVTGQIFGVSINNSGSYAGMTGLTLSNSGTMTGNNNLAAVALSNTGGGYNFDGVTIFNSGDFTESIRGLSINNSGDSRTVTAIDAVLQGTVTDDANGLRINMSGVTADSVTGLSVNLNGSVSSDPQGVTGISSDSRIGINATTVLNSGLGFQIGNRIESLFTIASGSPVTGTDSIGGNFAGDLTAQDDLANGGFGIGWNSIGFIASVGVAAGKTVDKATVFLPAMSLPNPGFATGGSITDLAMIRTYCPLASGGTAAVTNLYGFQLSPQFGNFSSIATNSWGIWIGDTDADNWFAKNVVIAGTTEKPIGSEALTVNGSMALAGATSGALTIQAAAVTTSHTLTMPAAQGAASTVLTNNGSGVLSWAPAGGSGYTSLSFNNNQASPADVTGFLVSNATNNGFVADFSILREMSDPSPEGTLNQSIQANLGTSFSSTPQTLAIDSNNNIFPGGSFTSFNGNSLSGIVKLSSAGVEDATFTTNAGTGFNDTVRGISVDSLDRVVIGGSFSTFNGNTRRKLIRLNNDGTEDSTFISNLGTAFPTGAGNFVSQIGIFSDDSMIAVGAFTSFNGGSPARVVMINEDGTFASGAAAAFNTNLGTGFDGGAITTFVQANGQILIGGSFTTLNGSGVAPNLVRLNSDGTLDTTFNTNLGTGFDASVVYVVEQPDTKILVAGSFTDLNGSSLPFFVRLNSDGTIDTSFVTAMGTGFDAGTTSIQVQNDDKILVSGTFTEFDGNGLERIARLNSDGSEDTGFTTTAGAGPNNVIGDFAEKSNGAVVAVGAFTQYGASLANRILEFGVIEELDQTGTFYGSYSNLNSTWRVSSPIGAFDDAGVVFSITAGGQLQYISTNLSGTSVTQELRWMIRGL